MQTNVFHCHGLLLCTTIDISRLVVWNPFPADISSLVVWNPCSGQTWSVQPKTSFNKLDKYALCYDLNNKHHKVLRFLNHQFLREFEIYNFDSNSWKVLDVNPDWDIGHFYRGLSLHGNTYWFAQDKIPPLGEDHSYFLLCFDFTTETFGPHLPLPFHPLIGDTVALSSVGENQLAVLFQRWYPPYTLKIWITSKIEPNAVSWNKLFLKLDMEPFTCFPFSITLEIMAATSRKSILANLGTKLVGHLGCSYVPSSVQINQRTP